MEYSDKLSREPKIANLGGRERAKSWASTTSTDVSSRNGRQSEMSGASDTGAISDDGCVTPPLRIVEETAAEIASSRENRKANDKSRQTRLEKESDSWIRYLIKEVSF
ncbi:unnamed protein product [Strongylus vulgaris]|uniref:Uncharacterized protein n=1 Tax=Strongylus vulgaris TaxID=40348 RepID=A0A3P7J4K7_STRVU|nr:unnamed protein product [Strongylus vulgaris]